MKPKMHDCLDTKKIIRNVYRDGYKPLLCASVYNRKTSNRKFFKTETETKSEKKNSVTCPWPKVKWKRADFEVKQISVRLKWAKTKPMMIRFRFYILSTLVCFRSHLPPVRLYCLASDWHFFRLCGRIFVSTRSVIPPFEYR